MVNIAIEIVRKRLAKAALSSHPRRSVVRRRYCNRVSLRCLAMLLSDDWCAEDEESEYQRSEQSQELYFPAQSQGFHSSMPSLEPKDQMIRDFHVHSRTTLRCFARAGPIRRTLNEANHSDESSTQICVCHL